MSRSIQYGNPQGWLFRLQAEVNVAGWDARGGTNQQNLFEFGISPIFRVEKRGSYFVPFAEALVVLTETVVHTRKVTMKAAKSGAVVSEFGLRILHVARPATARS